MKTLLWIAVVSVGAVASPSSGATFPFSGTFSNSNAPGMAGGRCPVLTVTISNNAPFSATGTSNLGAFTSSQSHCLDAGPPVAPGATNTPYYNGLFTFTFASGDTFSGTYTGLLSNAGAGGVVNNVQNFLITGGSGMFANATGSFLGSGQIIFNAGPPSATLAISRGTITTGAVPEPAMWGMMLAGFGAIGVAMRRRSSIRTTLSYG